MSIKSASTLFLFPVLILLSLSGFDRWFDFMQQRETTQQQPVRPQITDWVEVSLKNLKPPLDVHYPGAHSVWLYRHQHHPQILALLVSYTLEKQGEELVNSSNRILDARLEKPKFKGEFSLHTGQDEDLRFGIRVLEFDNREISIYSHYRILDRITTSAVQAKLLSIGKLFFPGSRSQELIFIIDNSTLEDGAVHSALNVFYSQISRDS